MLHIQIGPSPLALGLLIPTTTAAGFDVLVVARSDKPSDGRVEFELDIAGERPSHPYYTVRWWEHPVRATDLPDEALARMRSAEAVLITSTLRGAITARHGFMSELLDLRPHGAETVVMACENAPHRDYALVEEACIRTDARWVPTVVNRICVARADAPAAENRRLVETHELGEWLFPADVEASCLAALADIQPPVRAVVDLEARRTRKAWMVNGGHLALAILAHASKETSLMAAARDTVIAGWLHYLFAETNEALRRTHPGLSESLSYGMHHVQAYREVDDRVGRIVEGMSRADLSPFIRSLDLRLSCPARICATHGCSTEAYQKVFRELHQRVLLDLGSYADADAVLTGSIRLSANADRRAAAAYAQAIDWMALDTQGRLVAEFEDAQRSHRRSDA